MAAASFSSSSLLLILALSSLLWSCSAQSSVCNSQIFSGNRKFSRCVDLPRLNSTFHWTFFSQSSNLILAFKATPARPEGWIAWGINPTNLRMLGTQALVAYRGNGSMLVKTYNLIDYSPNTWGNITYVVSNPAAEVGGDGMMTIFATVKLPTNTSRINQVWQVGPSVTGSTLVAHARDTENLMATGVLDLEGGGMTAGVPVMPPTVAPSPAESGGVPVIPPAVAPSPAAGGGGNSGNKNWSVVLSLIFLLLCSSIWG